MEDPKKEIRTFVLRISAPAGTKRGQGRGSFVGSVLDTVDRFYTDVVQGLKAWTAPAPTVKPSLASRDETPSDEAITGALPVRSSRLDHSTVSSDGDGATEHEESEGTIAFETKRAASPLELPASTS